MDSKTRVPLSGAPRCIEHPIVQGLRYMRFPSLGSLAYPSIQSQKQSLNKSRCSTHNNDLQRSHQPYQKNVVDAKSGSHSADVSCGTHGNACVTLDKKSEVDFMPTAVKILVQAACFLFRCLVVGSTHTPSPEPKTGQNAQSGALASKISQVRGLARSG